MTAPTEIRSIPVAAMAWTASFVSCMVCFRRHPTDGRHDHRVQVQADVDSAAPSRARHVVEQRDWMVDTQIAGRGVRDGWVLHALRTVPREEFVPASLRPFAYDDGPLPISAGQTISQPYVVAVMTEMVRPTPAKRALEIGTGSGYAAAVLATIVSEVSTVERIAKLATTAKRCLSRLGYRNVRIRHGAARSGGPSRRRSMRSSSPPADRRCRPRCAHSWRSADGS